MRRSGRTREVFESTFWKCIEYASVKRQVSIFTYFSIYNSYTCILLHCKLHKFYKNNLRNLTFRSAMLGWYISIIIVIIIPYRGIEMDLTLSFLHFNNRSMLLYYWCCRFTVLSTLYFCCNSTTPHSLSDTHSRYKRIVSKASHKKISSNFPSHTDGIKFLKLYSLLLK